MTNKVIRGSTIKEEIGKGSLGSVYKAVDNNGNISAIKHISLPREDREVESLIKNGIIKNYYEADKYFANLIRKEIVTLKKISGNQFIVNFCDIYQENKLDGSGIDFYIRMEYAKDITVHFKNKKISTNDVIKIGIDICSALELCSSINISHNDIKPNNIFIGNDGNYKLGDFSAMTNIGDEDIPKFGTFNYLAPEVYNGKSTLESTDLYSLGLVMYKLLDGDLPFKTKENDEKQAFNLRMTGKKLPIIKGVDKKLMDILIKACSFKGDDRYKSAAEMKNALELLSHSSTNQKIDFIVNEYEDTLGIYEINELTEVLDEKVDLVSKIKNNFFDKNKLVKLSVISIFSGFMLFLGIGYFFDRNCDDGYVNRNGMCVKGYYFCNEGYTLNGDNQCQKTLESIDAKLTYICKSGYVLNGDVCVSQDVKQPQQVYKCADGFTLNGKKCEREESVDAVRTYSCPSGYVSAGDKCVTITNVDATKSGYTCNDSSYELSGTICKKITTETKKATINYSCESGGTLNGTVCKYTTSVSFQGWRPSCPQGTYNYLTKVCEYTKAANVSYICSQGTSDNKGNCIISSTSTKNATVKYSCPAGYTSVGNQCAKTTDISASIKYVCTDGAELRGSKCYTTISTDAVSMLECDEGYVSSATGCYKDDFPSAVKKYTCSRIYTLNGDKCEKYEIVSSKVHYDD